VQSNTYGLQFFRWQSVEPPPRMAPTPIFSGESTLAGSARGSRQSQTAPVSRQLRRAPPRNNPEQLLQPVS